MPNNKQRIIRHSTNRRISTPILKRTRHPALPTLRPRSQHPRRSTITRRILRPKFSHSRILASRSHVNTLNLRHRSTSRHLIIRNRMNTIMHHRALKRPPRTRRTRRIVSTRTPHVPGSHTRRITMKRRANLYRNVKPPQQLNPILTRLIMRIQQNASHSPKNRSVLRHPHVNTIRNSARY